MNKTLIASALTILSLALGACGGSTPVAGTPPPTPSPSPTPTAGVITGRVVDVQGAPVAGAEIVADNTLAYDSNLLATTGADGTYRIDIGTLPVTWMVTGHKNVTYNGSTVAVELTPENPDVVAGGPNGGGVRNFTYSTQASSPDNPYGSVGVIHVERGIGQYGVKEDHVTLTIVPVGKLADGSTGKTLVTKPVLSGDGWIVPNMMYGTYTVSAVMDGKALKIRQAVPRGDWPEWADSYTGGFTKDFGALKPTMFLELGDGE